MRRLNFSDSLIIFNSILIEVSEDKFWIAKKKPYPLPETGFYARSIRFPF